MESRPCFSTCPIGGAGGAYWVKAPLQPGLEELEAHMESTTTLNPGIQGPVSKRDGAEDRRRRLGQLWQLLLLQRLLQRRPALRGEARLRLLQAGRRGDRQLRLGAPNQKV